MARAQRHYIPGQIWHITHRCHKREFLLKFSKDRRWWLQWLYEVKKRYGLVILTYAVTLNHIHLLVVGSWSFVERVKSLMEVLAIGRKSIDAGESYQLREPAIPYETHFGT